MTAPVPATGVAAPVTTFGFDGDGREITVTDPLSGVTTNGFDANSNLTSVKDSVNNTTTFAFDHLNRQASETDANSQIASTVYNLAGQITSETDKNGRVKNFGYDHDCRMVQEQWMSGGTAIYTATWAYDAASNLTSVVAAPQTGVPAHNGWHYPVDVHRRVPLPYREDESMERAVGILQGMNG